ncbi:hypothetical protein VTK26DRAFT_6731 [Humicola hyalothermophila]
MHVQEPVPASRLKKHPSRELFFSPFWPGDIMSSPPYISCVIDRHASMPVRPKPNLASFTMPHPVIIVASFLTTIKSAWELSRMVREKRAAKNLKTDTKSTLVLLKRAYHKGLLLEREFDRLFERLMRAEAHNDAAALKRIRADFQAILARESRQPARRRV